MTDFADFAAAERAGWTDAGRIAAYMALFAPASDQIVAPMVTASGAAPGRRILDLCCGHGNVTLALAATGAEVTGLDFSAPLLAIARERVPGARFVEGDAQAMPFEDASFDTVTCNVGLGHVPDQPKAVAEIARVLKPGGIAALSAWCAPEISPAFQVLFGALKAHADDLSAAPAAPDFHLLAREAEAAALLGDAGFAEIRLTPVDVAFELDAPGDFAEIFRRATVRAAMTVGAQGPAAQERIWAAMAETVAARHADGKGRFRVPFPAMLATAVRA